MSNSELLSFLIKDKYFRILKPFFENKDSHFYVNQLKDITKVSPRILIKELKTLEKQGFLESEKIANALFYKLNKNSEKVKKIEVLFK